MTDTYEKFKCQYSSTGREKADGYDSSHFEGLADNEKVEVFNMLSEEIAANPDAVEWLFYLDPIRAETFCLDYIRKNKHGYKSGYFVIYYYLYKNSGDPEYQKKMIDEFYAYPDYQKNIALEYLGRTKASPELTYFFKSIIINRHDEDLANRASYHFLLAHQVPGATKTEQKTFYGFLDSLKNSEFMKRKTAVKEIDKLFPIKAQ